MEHAPLSEREEEVGRQVVDAAYTVHKALGPGLLERVYEVCFCHELRKRGLKYDRQLPLQIKYDGILFDEGLRVDVLVEDLVVVELKAVEMALPVHHAQLLTQLKMTGKRLGYLINFNVALSKDGIRRVIL